MDITTYEDDDLDFDLDALLPHLQKLDRRLAKLEAATGRFGNADPELAFVLPALEALDRRLDQLTGCASTLVRRFQRRSDRDKDGVVKRRIPRIMKCMSMPHEGEELFRGAATALACGTYESWRHRQRMAAS